MFKRGTHRCFHSALAVMVLLLFQQCHLTNPSEVCVPSASCSCSIGSNDRIKATCQVETLTNLTLSIRKPEEVHHLVITGINSPTLPENAFINFSNLAILSLRGNNLRYISNQSFNGLLQLSELDIGENKLQEWKGDINHQIPSLTTLDITGNTNWTITENILSHKSIRIIKGASISANCTACCLVRNYDDSEISEGNEGVIIQKGCVKHKYIFNKKNQELARHQFFPKCILQETRCLKAIGRMEAQNICLEVGRSILISAFPIGIFAFFLNLIVLVVIVTNKNLRSNASLLLVSSMCASGVISSVYSVAIATVYQIVPVNEIESKRVSICPSLGFIAALSLSSMILISLAVTIERYLAVVFCMKLHIRLRIRHAYYCLLVTWLVALSMAGWSVADSNIYSTKGYETYICLSIQSVLEKKYLAYTVTSIIISAIGYLPTIPLHVHIFVVVRKSGSKFGIKREATLARRIFLLVGSNVLFMAVPMCLSHVAIATGEMGGFSETSKFIVVTSTKVICMSINALLNPILYGCRNDNFKKALKKTWKLFSKRRGRNKLMDREDTPHRSDKCQKSQTKSTQL